MNFFDAGYWLLAAGYSSVYYKHFLLSTVTQYQLSNINYPVSGINAVWLIFLHFQQIAGHLKTPGYPRLKHYPGYIR